MTSKSRYPIKISEEGYNFLYDLQTNIRTLAKDKNKKRPDLTFPKVVEIITKYFKSNNERYVELIKLFKNENGK